MKLYYSPGACSQAPHIVLREMGVDFELARVDLKTKKLKTGEDYLAINPKGAVPALELEDGSRLTENGVVLQFLADRAPGKGLIPAFGTMERYRLLEWLNYIATELHKGFGPLFNPASSEETKAAAREQIGKKLDYVEQRLGEGPYLTGVAFTVADAYLFAILGWTRMHHIDLSRWPGLAALRSRIAQRPAVKAALQAEGLSL
jgi:glutathione S-transferase